MNDSIYEITVQKLAGKGIENPRLEARLLIADASGTSENEISYSTVIEENLKIKLEENIQKRIQGMPLDKILGRKGFYKYDFKVSEDVLSPRPETEILVEEALQLIKENQFKKVLDLGVGSGCILISLLKENPTLKGLGVDVSQKALKIAKENAQSLQVETQCRFLNKSWFENDFLQALDDDFDLIVSNPPYIKTKEIETLDVGVRKYDPIAALDGGKDGLKDYRRISELASEILKQNGYILLEVGLGQSDDVKQIFEKDGLKHVKTLKDYANIDRVVVFKKI